MLDTGEDKVSILNWLVAVGAILGGTIAGYFGTRSARSKLVGGTTAETSSDELMRLRAQVGDEALRRDLELVIEATRKMLLEKIERNHQSTVVQLEKLHELVAALERRVFVLELELKLKRGHKPGRDGG